MNRRIWIIAGLSLVMAVVALAKPKEKIYNNTTEQVFQAALRTAREKHVVTYVDEKHYMFTFETGTSFTSYGFNANASVEDVGGGKAKLIINVQKKNDARAMSWSLGAGDRMADKFFEQVTQELALESSQKVSVKPEAAHVDVPPAAQMAGSGQPKAEDVKPIGVLELVSVPDGAEVSVDGSFIGNAPASLRLTAGKHTIVVSAEGYKSWTRDLEVLAGSSAKLNAKLEKN